MSPKRVIKPKGEKKISTTASPMMTSSSENSPKFQKLDEMASPSTPSTKFTQLRMNCPNAKVLQMKLENESQGSPYKIKQEGSSSQSFFNKKKGKELQSNFQFGSVILNTYIDPNKKFKPYTGIEVDLQQQCLLDNLWHIQTLPNATSFKVQALNALSFYFSDLKKENKFFPNKKFSHYVIYRGTKLGVFHDFNTVLKFINCPNPLWKGYYSFKEALDNAREVLKLNFFIEPEEVKSFSQVASERPSEVISAQAEVIQNLEKQVVDLQNQLFLSNSKIQEMKGILDSKNHEILQNKKKISDLNSQNFSLKQKMQKLGVRENSFNFENLKARILDMPYTEALKPLFERLPELDLTISTKALEGMIADLQNLQHQCIQILFGEIQVEGIRVIQNSTYHCDPEKFKEFPKGVPGLFKLQINLNEIKWDCENILKYFHNGLIDFMEFRLTEEPSLVEDILEKFGEKFLLVGGNMASRSLTGQIYCKIFSSLPQITNGSYIPAKKRIFFDERDVLRNYDVSTTDFEGIDDNKGIIQYYQNNTEFETLFWSQFKLLAEGHYVQIFGRENWKILLPFSGEGRKLEDEDHIINTDEVFCHQDSNNNTDEEIPDTHRDF